MKIRYLSHACFEIKNRKTILIDPYFKGNKLAPEYKGKPDYVFVTHEHFDHSDAGQFNCDIICPRTLKFEKARIMKIGDKTELDGIKVEMVAAVHHQSEYATGYIIEMDGKRLYHPGDTYLQGIENLGSVGKIDIFFVPIGGNYTMNVDEAVEAVKIVKPKLAIPMHFNTFTEIKADPNGFMAKVEAAGLKAKVLKIGEEIEV